MWKQGKFGLLGQAVLAARSGSAGPSPRPTDDHWARTNRRRAVALAKEGAYSKAFRALLSDGIAPDTEATLSSLIDKHPQEPAPLSPGIFTSLSPPPVAPIFTPHHVLHATSRFTPASAAGGTGLRPNHLTELLNVPDEHPDTGL